MDPALRFGAFFRDSVTLTGPGGDVPVRASVLPAVADDAALAGDTVAEWTAVRFPDTFLPPLAQRPAKHMGLTVEDPAAAGGIRTLTVRRASCLGGIWHLLASDKEQEYAMDV